MGEAIPMKDISKYLSYILRHKPDIIGLVLDENGWANIDELIVKTKEFELTEELIFKIVQENDKQRFMIQNNKIRANQGHSINIDLNLKPMLPLDILYHGTASKHVDAIMREGIKSMRRQYVHLSNDIETATKVGSRHGEPIILKIDTMQMYKDGYEFYLSANGVWLTKTVPTKYIKCCSTLSDRNKIPLKNN